jgi:hypothetical protein
MTSSEREGLKKILEDRLKTWPVKGSEFRTAYSELGPGGLEKVLTESIVALGQAKRTDPDLHSWTVDNVLRDGVDRAGVGFVIGSGDALTFEVKREKKVEVE